ncbi:MAG TPA: acylneuraminate cytidylyltransferase family protein [Acidimicrobiia bacterium]|jgi:CMP-N-acetylneuraminic acid synthetase|nr:acylneuraminate cytidylyltransferase family protein [Acidimicrobiia bacterium]
MLNVVAFMPMRHSSERVPGKNYRDFNGAPLFHHMLQTLLACPQITQVVVDTDSPTVADQCAEKFPTVLVIPRPKHLLGGEVPMTEILRHDAGQLDADWYLQTHSTSPLLRTETISAGLAALEEASNTHDSLFSVTRLQTRLYDADGVPVNHDPAVLLRTQDLPPLYEENSGMYVFSRQQISEGRRFGDRPLLFEIDPLEATDIDEETDFVLAETLQRMNKEQTI